MVFASIWEHASSAFIFASASSYQFSHASSEHLRNYNGEQRELRKFSACWNLFLFKGCFASSNLADTLKTRQQAQSLAT